LSANAQTAFVPKIASLFNFFRPLELAAVPGQDVW